MNNLQWEKYLKLTEPQRKILELLKKNEGKKCLWYHGRYGKEIIRIAWNQYQQYKRKGV